MHFFFLLYYFFNFYKTALASVSFGVHKLLLFKHELYNLFTYSKTHIALM